MPFKSLAQKEWMRANDPTMAERWERHTPDSKKLLDKVKKSVGTLEQLRNELEKI